MGASLLNLLSEKGYSFISQLSHGNKLPINTSASKKMSWPRFAVRPPTFPDASHLIPSLVIIAHYAQSRSSKKLTEI